MKNKKSLVYSITLLCAFALWTVLLCTVDLKPLAPNGTNVGFATLNSLFHRLTGVNMTLYTITDWLGLVPFFFGLGFALLGLIQWIKRKSVAKVDYPILALGVFYVAVGISYAAFEKIVINFRPVLIEGVAEVSYPSSTTLLTLCIMPTAAILLRSMIKNKILKNVVFICILLFTAFMVIARLISGVHWLTDIIGGILLSGGLVFAYHYALGFEKKK